MNAENLISRLSTCSDAEAATLATPGTRQEMAERIMATPFEVHKPVRSRARRRILIGAPIAVGLAAAATVFMSVTGPGARVGPLPVGPAPALAFSRPAGGYITVTVKDPYADPVRYRKEFAEHGMHIDLRVVPASPSDVGVLLGSGAANPEIVPGQSKRDVKQEPRPDKRPIVNITARSACQTPGGGACIIGVKIPVGYRNHDMLVFGRAARPGEPYAATNAATAPGEVLHGLTVRNRRVADVMPMLKARGVTVAGYRVLGTPGADGKIPVTTPASVPGGWYVRDAALYADHQVLLLVSAKPYS
jgi:hypothetical protein